MPTNNNINTGKPIEVVHGGTQNASFTAYGTIVGGTTSTGALQNIGTGSPGQVLTSTGSSSLPVWSGGPGAWNLIQTQSVSNTKSLAFSIPSTYSTYMIVVSNLQKGTPDSNPCNFTIQLSNNGGASYIGSGYNYSGITTGFSSGSWSSFAQNNLTTWWGVFNNQVFGTNPLDGTIYLFNMTNGGNPTFLTPFNYQNGGQLSFGYYNSALVVNAIQLQFTPFTSTNPIQTGVFSLYGLSQ
jgi:hypothetical protein